MEHKNAEIAWLRSSLTSLLTLAEAKPSPLTNEQVASICRVTLNKYGSLGQSSPSDPAP